MIGIKNKTTSMGARLICVLAALLLVVATGCADDGGGSGGFDTGTNLRDGGGGGGGGADSGGGGGGTDGGGSTTDSGTDGGTIIDLDGGQQTDGGSTGQCQPVSDSLGACEPLCQTGCDTDQACVVSNSGPNEELQSFCQTAGTGGQGATCGSTSGCKVGFVCNTDTCQEICWAGSGTQEPTCSTQGTVCGGLQGSDEVGLCITPENECEQFPTEDTCRTNDSTTNCYQLIGSDGQPAGRECRTFHTSATVGSECEVGTDCGDLQVCIVNNNDQGHCRDLCDTQASASDNRCGSDGTCVAPPGSRRGYCQTSGGGGGDAGTGGDTGMDAGADAG